MKKRPPYLETFTSRHGKRMWFFRVGKGPRTRLPDEYGSPAFNAAYRAALAAQAVKEAPVARTLGWLIDQYRASPAWRILSAPQTPETSMTDIVERLRLYARQFEDQHAPQNLTIGLREAADEITRLRAEIERLRERAAVDLLAAATEITRLRALLDTVQRRSHTATPGNVVVEPGGIREAEAYLDRVNAALTGQPQSGWRPIETAPHEEVVLLGWWQSDWLGNDDWVSEVDHASFGWRRGSISSRSYHGRATHWQPLPPPPQKENET